MTRFSLESIAGDDLQTKEVIKEKYDPIRSTDDLVKSVTRNRPS